MREKRIMMKKGERNGRLKALRFVERDTAGQSHWLFRCDCGRTVSARVGAVRSGNTVSCGCQKIESATRHGMSRTPEYRAWRAMIDRCVNPANKNFHNYGGRGIAVCKRWRRFDKFIADVGLRPSARHSIDRFPNNDGGYKPSNWRWATASEQNKNRRKRAKRGR